LLPDGREMEQGNGFDWTQEPDIISPC
jgi:hypothetical protein